MRLEKWNLKKKIEKKGGQKKQIHCNEVKKKKKKIFNMYV